MELPGNFGLGEAIVIEIGSEFLAELRFTFPLLVLDTFLAFVVNTPSQAFLIFHIGLSVLQVFQFCSQLFNFCFYILI